MWIGDFCTEKFLLVFQQMGHTKREGEKSKKNFIKYEHKLYTHKVPRNTMKPILPQEIMDILV